MSNDDLTEAEVMAFLAELTELTQRHRISIGGCGHCGSPYMERCDDPGKYSIQITGWGNYIEWNDLKWTEHEPPRL